MMYQEIELVESIKLYRSKGNYYRLSSPIMNIYYYLDSRYDISNREAYLEEIKPTLERLISLEIQNFIADLFVELYRGRKEYVVSKDKEVDFIITKRNKAEIIGEVKWKKINQEDINKFIKNSENLNGRKILICKTGQVKQIGIELIDSTSLVDLTKKRIARLE